MTGLPEWAETIGSLLGAVAVVLAPIWAYKGSARTSRAAVEANRNASQDAFIQRIQAERETERQQIARDREAERQEFVRREEKSDREEAQRAEEHKQRLADLNEDHKQRLAEVNELLAKAHLLVEAANRKERILSDYIHKLRQHIDTGAAPPPPPWPQELT